MMIVILEGRAGLTLRSIAQNFRFRFWGVQMGNVLVPVLCMSFFLFYVSNVYCWCKDEWLDVMYWSQIGLGINHKDSVRQNELDTTIGTTRNV